MYQNESTLEKDDEYAHEANEYSFMIVAPAALVVEFVNKFEGTLHPAVSAANRSDPCLGMDEDGSTWWEHWESGDPTPARWELCTRIVYELGDVPVPIGMMETISRDIGDMAHFYLIRKTEDSDSIEAWIDNCWVEINRW